MSALSPGVRLLLEAIAAALADTDDRRASAVYVAAGQTLAGRDAAEAAGWLRGRLGLPPGTGGGEPHP